MPRCARPRARSRDRGGVTGSEAFGSRVRTVFIGSGGFAVPSLRTVATHPDVEIVGVVTAPRRPAGRRREPVPTPIDEAADALGIHAVQRPPRLRDPEAMAGVLGMRPGLVVLADYGQIVPAPLLGIAHGALNVHPSLLPRHRGATPIPAAILAGDPVTGVTLMRMDAGLDTGPIVAQVRIPMDGTETTPDLETRLAVVAADLLKGQLGPWLRGMVDARPQPGVGVTLTRPLRREDGRLDPAQPAVVLERQVRAYQPWPATFVDTIHGRLVIWSADGGSASGDRGAPPGTFTAVGLVVGNGERLVLGEVQPAGGRRMPWEDFVRGRPTIVGSRVVPPSA